MTDGQGPADDPTPSLEALADALAELVTAARNVAEAGSTVLGHPAAREAIATVLTTALDGLVGAFGGIDVEPDG